MKRSSSITDFWPLEGIKKHVNKLTYIITHTSLAPKLLRHPDPQEQRWCQFGVLLFGAVVKSTLIYFTDY